MILILEKEKVNKKFDDYWCDRLLVIIIIEIL